MTRAQLLGGTMLGDTPRVPLHALGVTEQISDPIASINAALTELRIREAARLMDAAFGYDEGWGMSAIQQAMSFPVTAYEFDEAYRFDWPSDYYGDPSSEPRRFSGLSYLDLADRDRRRRGLRSDMIARVICPA